MEVNFFPTQTWPLWANGDGGEDDTSMASEDDAFSADAFPASAVEPSHRPLGPSAWLELVGLPRGVKVSDGLRRDLARVACPEYLRGRAWKRLLEPAARRMQRRSVIPLSRLRQGALKGADAEGDALVLEVDKDMDRTSIDALPGGGVTPAVLEDLQSLLVTYGRRNPRVGYCQGMNFIALLLLQYLQKEDAFWALAVLVEQLFPDHYSRNLLGNHVDQRVLRSVLALRRPDLVRHLDDNRVAFPFFATQWVRVTARARGHREIAHTRLYIHTHTRARTRTPCRGPASAWFQRPPLTLAPQEDGAPLLFPKVPPLFTLSANLRAFAHPSTHHAAPPQSLTFRSPSAHFLISLCSLITHSSSTVVRGAVHQRRPPPRRPPRLGPPLPRHLPGRARLPCVARHGRSRHRMRGTGNSRPRGLRVYRSPASTRGAPCRRGRCGERRAGHGGHGGGGDDGAATRLCRAAPHGRHG